MKKALVFLVALICFGIAAKAQSGTGYCNLPGGEDYVNVDYYNDGHLAISVNTEKTVTNLHVTVTCTHEWQDIQQVYENGRPVDKKTPRSETITLCNQTYYTDNLKSNQTNIIRDGVKPNKENSHHRYTYTVSASNPRCK